MPDSAPPDRQTPDDNSAADAPAAPGAQAGAPRFLPFDAPREAREAAEGRTRRGCHPLVFGIVMATIQLAATLYFMSRC